MFGGVGLMVRQPGWHLRVSPGESDLIDADVDTTERVVGLLASLRGARSVPPVSVRITSSVPFHAGLGSGTQLALALASALELLVTRRLPADPWTLASIMNRAERSAIGTAGFRSGGFLVDHGLGADESSQSTANLDGPPSAARRIDRMMIPDTWRFVLVRPLATEGLCGERERSYFARPRSMPQEIVHELKNIILQRIVPAITAQEFAQFASAIEDYGRKIGGWYAPVQGGIFSNAAIGTLANRLREHGVTGAAQSSWGPGIAIPARDANHAEHIRTLVPATIDGQPLQSMIVEPLNTGATLRTEAISPTSDVAFA